MKVITFNIRCVDDPEGHSIDERAPRLKKVLDKHDADIVGFQEVTPHWLNYLEKDFGEAYEIFNVWRAEENHESTPIMWKKDKLECLEKGHFWLSDTPDKESRSWDKGCYRTVLWTVFKEKETGKTFLYVNTHYGFGDECQKKSSRLIIDFVKSKHRIPAILTGDFNMKLNSVGYSKITEYFKDVNMETVRDLGDTFHNYLNTRGEHIDYCFINSAVKAKKSRVLNETYEGKFPSDHYGILSELEI